MSIVVMAVMAILILASVVTWVIIVERARTMNKAKKALFEFEERFWSGMDLTQLYKQVYNDPNPEGGAESIFRNGFKEFTRLRQQNSMDPESVMVGTQRAMRVAARKESDKLDKHISFLATVGSITPYIGLLGTVWGIMNSFQGLSDSAQLTLAAVAPGISEALSATAMGLFAAIPAVVAYNRFVSQSETIIGSYETFSDEFTSILHRQIHAAKPQPQAVKQG
ncbi:protein TolQ [Marinicellulosiphila megalodicopiae]|uniref:protein TolQ n=1 Tax=Marinicellulosiphila megalodicopiae TaxID=2724896 RepID=UPI003BB0511D